MDHLTAQEILELERLPSAARAAALTHVAGCRVCAEALAAQQQLAATLEGWQTPDPPDHTQAILDRMIVARRRRVWPARALRIAAAVALAAGAGHLAARWTAPVQASVGPEQAAAALHLDELGDQPASPLLNLLEEPAASAPGEVQP